MKKAEMVVRILLGLMMVVFGLNKFLGFIPLEPANMEAGVTMKALMGMGVLTVSGIIEVIGGILLLINKQTGVALFFLAPIAFCAFLFHLMLDPAGIGGSIFFLLATAFLIFGRKEKFMALMD